MLVNKNEIANYIGCAQAIRRLRVKKTQYRLVCQVGQ